MREKRGEEKEREWGQSKNRERGRTKKWAGGDD